MEKAKGKEQRKEESGMMERKAVLYARVSSREQQQEGYSIDAQLRMLRTYAAKNRIDIAREFIDIESAKATGRKQFGEMIEFLRRSRDCRMILVEKTDRLTRNFRDHVLVEDLGVEVIFVKTGTVVSKDARAQTKFMQGIELVSAKYYSDNLREEVIKGMREKAEQGIYPGRAPYGYRNNRASRNIDVDSGKSGVVQFAFDRYGTGTYSLTTLQKAIRKEFGTYVNRAYLHCILTNPVYVGLFVWRGERYRGTHVPLISTALFDEVQRLIHTGAKGKYGKHQIAFKKMLKCAHDGCTVTAEVKKGKYVYYRCSGYKGPCDLPRFREQEIAERMGSVLLDIHIPDGVARSIEESLQSDRQKTQRDSAGERARLEREVEAIRRRMGQAYEEKLDGKIDEALWSRKRAEWESGITRIEGQLAAVEQGANSDKLLDAKRILELANRAYFLYLTRKPAEQADLLRKVLLNCSIDSVSLYPTYRKPFDLIAKRVKTEEWSGREDLNLRPPGPTPGGRACLAW